MALITWQAITGADPGARPLLAYAVAALVGAAGALAFARAEAGALVPSVLGVAPVVVLVLFLGVSPVRTFAFGGGGPEPERVRSNGAPRRAGGARRAPDGVADGRPRADRREHGCRASPRWPAGPPGTATRRPPPTTRSSRCRRSSPGAGPAAAVLQVASEHPRQPLHAARRRATGSTCSRRSPTSAGRRATARCASRSARRMRGLRRPRSTRSPRCHPSSEPGGGRHRARGPGRGRGGHGASSTARASGASSPPPRTSASRASSTRSAPAGEPTLNYMHLVLPHRPWRLPARRAAHASRALARRVRALA